MTVLGGTPVQVGGCGTKKLTVPNSALRMREGEEGGGRSVGF